MSFLACYILHNYLLGVDLDKSLIEEVNKEISNELEDSNVFDETPIDVEENDACVSQNHMRVYTDIVREESI